MIDLFSVSNIKHAHVMVMRMDWSVRKLSIQLPMSVCNSHRDSTESVIFMLWQAGHYSFCYLIEFIAFQVNKLIIAYYLFQLMIKEEQEANNYVPSRYSKAFNSYSRNEIRWVVPILRSVARSCHIAFRYPVYKVLKAVAKIFLMNEVQAIFFAYMIRETNWDIKDKLITQNSQQVRDIVCYINDQPEYKNLILYLMLVTYTLKFFLNEHIEELLEEAIRICPNFKLIFENWAKKHSNLTKRINPKTLNKVYQDLHFKIRHEEPDFNLLVDSILQISPAYNPEKNQKEKKAEKKDNKETQPRETLPREQPQKMVKTQTEASIEYNNPIFSSSRIYEMVGGVGVGLNISEASNFQVFGLQKSGNIGTRFGNSVFGSSGFIGGANYSIKDQDQYCEELNLGLQQGQSEQNINMRQAVADFPPNSILNLSRNNSITDRYLNMKGEGSDYHS